MRIKSHGNITINNNTTITSASILVNMVQNLGWNDGANHALNATGYSMSGGVQINGQKDSLNNIHKRAGDATIALYRQYDIKI